MLTLYHYTCEHSLRELGQAGTLTTMAERGYDRPLWPDWQRLLLRVIWLTDLDHPYRHALGLTRDSIDCDRTMHRYRAVRDGGTGWALHYPRHRRSLPDELVEELESTDGAKPMHWWLSYSSVEVVYDPILTPTEIHEFAGGV